VDGTVDCTEVAADESEAVDPPSSQVLDTEPADEISVELSLLGSGVVKLFSVFSDSVALDSLGFTSTSDGISPESVFATFEAATAVSELFSTAEESPVVMGVGRAGTLVVIPT
jgi:hypothetical protein